MKITLTPATRLDIKLASEWYEAHRENLGLRFIDRFEQGLDKIERNPTGFQKATGENRKCVLEKFPYAIWFQVLAEEIVVLGCLHGKRAPRIARERGLGIIEMRNPAP